MYHFIVKRTIRRSFRNLSHGDYETVLKLFSPSVRFAFAGEHALGGEQQGVEAVRLWFQRLYRLLPGLRFEVQNVLVNGWPWNTVAATHFIVRTVFDDGRSYTNAGVQIIRLRWGRIVEDYLYEDTQKLVAELQYRAGRGIQEAVAAPISR